MPLLPLGLHHVIRYRVSVLCVSVCLHGTAQDSLSLYQSVTLTVHFQHRERCVSISAAWLVKMSKLHELWAAQPCVMFDEICMTLAELCRASEVMDIYIYIVCVEAW